MKKTLIILSILASGFIYSCGGGENQSAQNAEATSTETEEEGADDEKGIGPINNVTLSTPLNQDMLTKAQDIYKLKCSACHRLDNTKLVGPGWKDVTKRRKPEWIMNFVTNADEMLSKDPQAIALLEECLVRMPNQNLTEDDARAMLEFMRQNDGEK